METKFKILAGILMLFLLSWSLSVCALQIEASASSVEEPGSDVCCEPENAIDGVISTRWSSNFSEPQWLEIDLEKSIEIVGLTLKWQTAYGKSYDILLSEDGKYWQKVYVTTEGNGKTDDIYFNKSTAKFLKIYGKKRGTYWGYSLWEVSVKGADEEPFINASSSQEPHSAENVMDGSIENTWHSNETGCNQWLMIDFRKTKAIGGLDIFWGEDYAKSYEILLSNDAVTWSNAYNNTKGNGGKDIIYILPTSVQFINISLCNESNTQKGYGIKEIKIKAPEEYINLTNIALEEYYRVAAKESPKGYYPRWLLDEQSFWTIIGAADDEKEIILSEDGIIEPHKRNFTIMPFLYINNTLITYEDVNITQLLKKDYLPIPSVEWNYGGIILNLTMFAYGNASENNSIAYARYEIKNNRNDSVSGKLFLAIRPFQIYPPWQGGGGFAPIHNITYNGSVVEINNEYKIFTPVKPNNFGAKSGNFGTSRLLEGDIISDMEKGFIPAKNNTEDMNGDASAAIEYNFNLSPLDSEYFFITIPLYDKEPDLNAVNETSHIKIIFEKMLNDTTLYWEEKVNRVEIDIPELDIVNTLKANIAYIFINKDGPALQPGSRTYDKAFIRDGGVIATALLRMGFTEEAKEFIDWYTGYQFDNGEIPCVIDNKAEDPFWENIHEYDSQGQYLSAVLNYYYFNHFNYCISYSDNTYLKNKLPNITSDLEFMVELRNLRLTHDYNGTVFYGLIPRYDNYADNFWALKGWKNGKTITQIISINNSYLFNWNNVPGNENDSLIDFLNTTLRVNWIENAAIKKSDDNKTINVKKGNNSVIIKLDITENKVILKIDNGRSYTCFSKDENDDIAINLTQWTDEEYTALKNSVYNSINLTIDSKNISYIPKSPGTNDFWAPSIADAVIYCGELNNLPQPELNNTFDKYYNESLKPRLESDAYDFTPYEVKIAEAFVYMNQKERALELLRFILDNRKPIGWNQFTEDVHSPERARAHFGDMPHVWVGAEYINAVRSLFVYELDDKLILGHGIDEGWLEREEGISIKNFPTQYGKISYTMKKHGNSLEINISGDACPPGGFVFKSPLANKIVGVKINGIYWNNFSDKEVIFDKLPVVIRFTSCSSYDVNYDGVYVRYWQDLMNAYKCFLGINKKRNIIQFQYWEIIKQEYQCFMKKEI